MYAEENVEVPANVLCQAESRMKDEKVSIITTVLNERGAIGELLNAFLSQSREPDEIVIVDGGSTDGTREVLHEHANKDSRIRYFVESNVNIARGRNIAIERASYPLIAVTDGGCRPERDWLKELIRPLQEDEGIGAVAGGLRIEARTRFEFFSGLLTTANYPGSEEKMLFYGRTSAFRKSFWAAAEGYPEWLYTAEDTLFALRARALGCRVIYSARSVASWRPRASLRKLAKQYFLYGRGTGRIARGNLRAAIYHLRYHALWMATLLAGLAVPWLWGLTVGVFCYLYFAAAVPVLRTVRKECPDRWREIYVPYIVMIRSLCNNLGQVVGIWEYRFRPRFRDNLQCYVDGRWKRACGKDVSSSEPIAGVNELERAAH
jgi:succinoglycan biosynthesis protein ExoA